MTLLLIGGSSFVGAAIRALPGWPATGWWSWRCQAHDDEASVHLDCLDAELVRRVIGTIRPTHILDCSIPGRDDPNQSARAAANVCSALREISLDVRYVFASTDAVFSGNGSRPYTEADNVAPYSDYGRGKAACERIFQESLPNCCVARTALVYGQDYRQTPPALNARLHSLLTALDSRQEVPQYGDQYRTPTYLGDLAPALLGLVLSDVRGCLHLAGPARSSRVEFAREAASAFGFDPLLVIDQPLGARPAFGRDTSLSSEKARYLIGWDPIEPVNALALLAKSTERHRNSRI